MADETGADWELHQIRTCSVSTPDGDVVAAFAIDGCRYTDPQQARAVYSEAWDEMSRRGVACEWETRTATPNEPAPMQPSWEQYRVHLDDRHPASDHRA